MSVALLAHVGPGSSWQAMVVVAGLLLAGVALAAAIGVLRIDSADDLVTPLATTAIAASFGLVGEAWFSDWIGWAGPLAVVSLLVLLLAAFTPLDIRFPAPLPMGAIALTAVAILALYEPLTVALHPDAEILPLRDDAEVRITGPSEDAEVGAGDVEVTVVVEGGSVGAGATAPDDLGDDPEEAGELLVSLAEVTDDGVGTRRQVPVTPDQACDADAPCSEVSFPVELEPGTWELSVELLRGDGVPLAPSVRDRVVFDAS